MNRNQNNQINQNQTYSLETSSAFVADQPANDLYYEIFTIAIAFIFFAAFDYFLRSFWILDNKSETHICNKIMLHRFRKTRNVSLEAMLINETRSKIETIEEVEISINALEGKIWKMLFIEICYISNFMTNITASKKFRAKRVYFDDQNMRLHVNNRTLRLVSDMNDHDVLKHQVIKHAKNEIIKQSTSEGVKMKNEKSTSEKVQVKKTKQINDSKQTDNGTLNRIKNERNGAYQRANNTQSHSKIKFKSFSPISSKWLKHKKKINVKPASIIHIPARLAVG